MKESRNLFRLRRSESIDTDTDFLRLFEPGILEVLGDKGIPETVQPIRSAAGGGKHWFGIHENLNGSDRGNDSSYYHATKKHRSSVQNSTGAIVRSSDRSAGIWARAWQPATGWGNKAYWYTY